MAARCCSAGRNDYKRKGKGLDESQRPKNLDGSAGSGQVLMTLKRVKP